MISEDIFNSFTLSLGIPATNGQNIAGSQLKHKGRRHVPYVMHLGQQFLICLNVSV